MTNLRYLYKFRHFEDNKHLRILTDDEIFFSSAKHFNDPFDSRIPVCYDEGTREEVVAHWARYLAVESPNVTPELRQRMAEEIYDSGRFRTPEGRENVRRIIEQFALTRVGIFSLTPNYQNILMWSHYSHSHSGFVVGFLTQDVKNFSLTFTAKTDHILLLDNIRYNKHYPLLNAYRTANRDQMVGQLLTKAVDWSYEDEYRILLQDGVDTPIKIPYDLIRRVILGCQISDANKERTIEILRNRRDKPALFQAVKADQSFSLSFRLVRY